MVRNNTDFDDGDLVQDAGRLTKQPGTQQSAGRLAKHREAVSEGVVGAMDEIERLRRRQHEIEQEKRDLEELSRKQEEYERGKREMIQHLNEGIMVLEKKEVQSAQLTELLSATRTRFKDLLGELENIDEEQWQDEHFRGELYKAIVVVDDARMEYNKAFAKIEVLDAVKDSTLSEQVSAARPGQLSQGTDRSFFYWIKVGFAVSLPILIMLLAVAGAYLALRRFWPI